MTINIHNASNVTVEGRRTGKNCKVVYDIDARKFYASVGDTADALGVSGPSVSYALNNETPCKGHRLCFVSRILEYLDVINKANKELEERDRINAEKIAAYDAIMAERRAQEEREEDERRRKAEAQENLAKHKAKCEELRAKLEKEMALMKEAEELCNG